jgi:hypothetical protein
MSLKCNGYPLTCAGESSFLGVLTVPLGGEELEISGFGKKDNRQNLFYGHSDQLYLGRVHNL